jgi:hypothetical protein
MQFAIFGITEQFLWFFQVSGYLDSIWIKLNQSWPRGAMLLEDTGSARSLILAVGYYDVWTHQIVPYQFV